MSVARFVARPAEGYLVENRNVVLDDARFARHKRRCVVEHYSAAEARRRMDVHAENFARNALQIVRQSLAVGVPEPVRNAVGCYGLEALEIKQRIQKRRARGVARLHCDDVGDNAVPYRFVGVERVAEELVDVGRRDGVSAEFARYAPRNSVKQVESVGNRLAQKRREHGLGNLDFSRLALYGLPQIIGVVFRILHIYGRILSAFTGDFNTIYFRLNIYLIERTKKKATIEPI